MEEYDAATFSCDKAAESAIEARSRLARVKRGTSLAG
jgi:hypothetical protein